MYRGVRYINLSQIKQLFNNDLRLYSAASKKTAPTSDLPVYIPNEEEHKHGKKQAITAIEQLFNVNKFNAVEIASRNKKLWTVSRFTLKTNFSICKEYGITAQTLLKYPTILVENDLEEKIKDLKLLPLDVNVTAPLLTLSIFILNKFVEQELSNIRDGNSRITQLTNLLEVSENEVCEFLTSRSFLRTRDLKKIEENINTLIEFGITKEDIKKDLWVLRYNNSLIKYRLTAAKKFNVDRIKTWMVRSQPGILELYVKRRSDNKLILGDNSLAEYLSQRLDCTVEQAKCIIEKHPAIQSKSLTKVKQIIDFLYSYGFKPGHISRVPKILFHSVETTRKRLKELEEQGLNLDSLYILTKSQKQYMQYYEGLVKANKKLKVKSN